MMASPVQAAIPSTALMKSSSAVTPLVRFVARICKAQSGSCRRLVAELRWVPSLIRGTARSSDPRVFDSRTRLHHFLRRVLERLVCRQHDGGGTQALMLRSDPGRRLAFLHQRLGS